MGKVHVKFVCNQCGYECVKWMGKCPSCGTFGSLTEFVEPVEDRRRGLAVPEEGQGGVVDLKDVTPLESQRMKTDIEEFNRVLGGGVVKGSVVLAGGEPGIGKSTLMLQSAGSLGKIGCVLYISGEESQEQVKMRADRLGVESDIKFASQTEIQTILATAKAVAPKFLIVDSIQTIYDSALTSAPGSVSQIRECGAKLAMYAKKTGTPVFIIGHVTKQGAIAGPKILEHLVDTVLYFEGERSSAFRILRAVKNRFGSTDEIGVFEMTSQGMKEVENPSAVMTGARSGSVAGSTVFCALEGTRPVLTCVEALVSTTAFGMPRRMASGVDYNRMNLIVAVLEKKVGLKLYNQDIFVNVAGGLRLTEPGLDGAIAASIVSSFRNIPLSRDMIVLGEIGLTGDIRPVSQIDKRISEAVRMGYEKVVCPAGNALYEKPPIEVVKVQDIGSLLANIL